MPQIPQTLFAMAGVIHRPPALDDAVLLIIDAQCDYGEGPLKLVGVDAATAEIARVLDAARMAGAPVIHVVHHAAPGAPFFNPEGPGSAPLPQVAPLPGEPVIVKKLINAFAGTDLDAALAATGRRTVVVVGFMTHNCVSSAVRNLQERGLSAHIIAAACATRDLPGPDGEAIPAAMVQAACLAGLSDRLAAIWPNADALTAAA